MLRLKADGLKCVFPVASALTFLGACCCLPCQAQQILDAEAQPLPVAIAPTAPLIRYEGRFDAKEAEGPRCSWSASKVEMKFHGSHLNVKLKESGDSDEYEVVVDGKPEAVLVPKGGTHLYNIFSASASATHTIALVKRTEGFFGVAQFQGFQLSAGGRLLALPPRPQRRIEVIGDSISCGYGNEGKNQNEHFSSKTENAYLTYGAITARTLGAEYTCVAWSGRTMWPKNTMDEVYGRTLANDPGSVWDFSRWTPDVIVINLGTNDFAGSNPDRKAWTDGYKAFLARVRKNYPLTVIYCASSPMLWGDKDTIERAYLHQIVQEENMAGDQKVRFLDFKTQQASDGFGADWHPSVKTQQIMAEKLTSALQNDLGWKPTPSQSARLNVPAIANIPLAPNI